MRPYTRHVWPGTLRVRAPVHGVRRTEECRRHRIVHCLDLLTWPRCCCVLWLLMAPDGTTLSVAVMFVRSAIKLMTGRGGGQEQGRAGVSAGPRTDKHGAIVIDASDDESSDSDTDAVAAAARNEADAVFHGRVDAALGVVEAAGLDDSSTELSSPVIARDVLILP